MAFNFQDPFAGIENAKFRQKVVPGDLLRLEVEMTTIKRNIGKAKAKAYVEDKLACQCELMFAIGLNLLLIQETQIKYNNLRKIQD